MSAWPARHHDSAIFKSNVTLNLVTFSSSLGHLIDSSWAWLESLKILREMQPDVKPNDFRIR